MALWIRGVVESKTTVVMTARRADTPDGGAMYLRRGGAYALRTCEECGERYEPTGSNQKWCVVCGAKKCGEYNRRYELDKRLAARAVRYANRTCGDCGDPIPIKAHGRTRFCPECSYSRRDRSKSAYSIKTERRSENNKAAENSAAVRIPRFECPGCHTMMVRRSANQKRCRACSYKNYLDRQADRRSRKNTEEPPQ